VTACSVLLVSRSPGLQPARSKGGLRSRNRLEVKGLVRQLRVQILQAPQLAQAGGAALIVRDDHVGVYIRRGQAVLRALVMGEELNSTPGFTLVLTTV